METTEEKEMLNSLFLGHSNIIIQLSSSLVARIIQAATIQFHKVVVSWDLVQISEPISESWHSLMLMLISEET